MRKLMILMAAIAAAGVMAVPAMASAATVTLHEKTAGGTALATGTAVTGFSSNLKFHTKEGPVLECAESTVHGKVTANPGATVAIESGSFTASGGGPNCLTNVPGLTAVITASGFNWSAGFTAAGSPLSGVSEITGVKFSAQLSNGLNCEYGGTVHNTFPLGVAFVDSITATTFPRLSGTAGCPESGELMGQMTVTKGASKGGVTIIPTSP